MNREHNNKTKYLPNTWRICQIENAAGTIIVVLVQSSVDECIVAVVACCCCKQFSVCLLSNDIRENVFEQLLHRYFLISECVCICARRFDRSANARQHISHWNGFSPVCVRTCPCKSHGRENALPQILHLHGSVCVRICIFSAPNELYVLSQNLHWNCFLIWATQWNCLCFDRPPNVE